MMTTEARIPEKWNFVFCFTVFQELGTKRKNNKGDWSHHLLEYPYVN